MRISTLFLIIVFYSCGQESNSKKNSAKPDAKSLNDSATLIVKQTQDYAKAISLLDEATQLDSNYLVAYRNKLSFQLQLKQYDQALLTAHDLKRLKPAMPDYYTTIGILYDIKGDTVSSSKFFAEASAKFDSILDTMSKTSMNYDILLMNKAINLILLDEQQKGNDILKQLHDKHKEEGYRESLALLRNKSKQELLEYFVEKR